METHNRQIIAEKYFSKKEAIMKKLSILAVLIMALVVFSTAHAENKAGDFSIGASAGGYFFEGNQGYKNALAWGIRGGYNFTDHLATEIFVNLVPSEFEGDFKDGDTNRVYLAGIEGIYNIMPSGRFVPYVALGIGAIHYSSDDKDFVPSKFTVDYGAGVKFFATPNLAVRADIRHVLPIGDDEDYGNNPHNIHHDFMATLGFSYYFTFGGGR